jgi:hypothetical protein
MRKLLCTGFASLLLLPALTGCGNGAPTPSSQDERKKFSGGPLRPDQIQRSQAAQEAVMKRYTPQASQQVQAQQQRRSTP